MDPALCRGVDIYCERTGTGFAAEPLNAVTNVAFLAAAWAAHRLYARYPSAKDRHLIRGLILLTALIGLGSLTFHTIATRWAVWLDVVPILIFMLAYLWLTLRRFVGWPVWPTALAVSAFCAATLHVESVVPVSFLAGGAVYLPALVVLLGVAATLRARGDPQAGRRLALAAGVFMLSVAARSADAPLCQAWPIGTHFVWHVLNALLLLLLVRLAILHGAARSNAG
jgi:hypothetical protein